MGAMDVWNGRIGQAAEAVKPQVGIAGYAYDRVRAIQDGRLGLDGYDITFNVQDIYHLNAHVFGSTRVT